MDILTLALVKKWLRVDYESDDELITLLIAKAREDVKNSVDNFEEKLVNIDFLNLVKLDMLKQISFDYDNRNSFDKETKIQLNFLSSRLQMRFSYVPEEVK